MTADLVIRCDGARDGDLCPARYTAEGATLLPQVRHEARVRGWQCKLDGRGTDLCPRCAELRTTRGVGYMTPGEFRDTFADQFRYGGPGTLPGAADLPAPDAALPTAVADRCATCGRRRDDHYPHRHPPARPGPAHLEEPRP